MFRGDRNAKRETPPRWGGSWLAVLAALGVAFLLVALLLPPVRRARPAAHRTQCLNQLRQLGLALHNYAAEHTVFPPAYICDGDGNRLHSWRTLVLPYMDQQELYESIDLSKSWDDPVNATAHATQLEIFQCPSVEDPGTQTTYFAVVTPKGVLRPTESRPYDDASQKTRKLLLMEVPVEDAVHWMSPYDVDEKLFRRIQKSSGLPHEGRVNIIFENGSGGSLSVKQLTTEWPE